MIIPLLRFFSRRVIQSPPPKFRIGVLLAAVLSYGTTGFVYFELPSKPDLTWPDALWWSIVTMTTVGYGDYFPTTAGGRFLVAAPLMFFGIGLLGYVLSLAATALTEARSLELSGMSRVRVEDHIVVINFPNVGKVAQIVDELREDRAFRGKAIVLIDEHLESIPAELLSREVHFVRGNPSRDNTLERANVDKASHAVVLARNLADPHSDDLTLAIALAIEARAPAVRTTVECVDASNAELFRKAACDSIVCAGKHEAHFVSSEVLHPGVQDVVADLLTASGQQLHVVRTAAGTFGEARTRAAEAGHIAIGVRRQSKTVLNVASDYRLLNGDAVVTIGDRRLDEI